MWLISGGELCWPLVTRTSLWHRQFNLLGSRLDELCEQLLPFQGEVLGIANVARPALTDVAYEPSSSELDVEQPKESSSDASLLVSPRSSHGKLVRPPDPASLGGEHRRSNISNGGGTTLDRTKAI